VVKPKMAGDTTCWLDAGSRRAGVSGGKEGLMTKMVRGFLVLAFCVKLAVPAVAGIVDTPLPVLLTGAPTFH
jgi:hypothetical protein